MTDAEQFECFVRRHQDMVFATAFRLLGDRAEAEDVAQTVFLRAFERFGAIGSSPTAAGWLKVVTRNRCLDHLKRYRLRRKLFSEIGDGDPEVGDPAPGASPETRASLERALAGLPPSQRVPLVLFHFEGSSYKEIAALLGVSVAKVRTDIYRGREALRRFLEASGGSR